MGASEVVGKTGKTDRAGNWHRQTDYDLECKLIERTDKIRISMFKYPTCWFV